MDSEGGGSDPRTYTMLMRVANRVVELDDKGAETDRFREHTVRRRVHTCFTGLGSNPPLFPRPPLRYRN